MKRLLLILILTLSFQSWTKADDISEFEIEGMSIGDSLLDYFNETEIINAVKTYYPNSQKFYSVHILVNSENYDQVSFGIKDKDKNYIIYKLAGDKYFKENPNLCLKRLKMVAKDFDKEFGVSNKIIYTHQYSSIDDGKSYSEVIDYNFKNNSAIRIWCNFFTKETIKKRDLVNGLTVSLDSNEWLKWLNKEAY